MLVADDDEPIRKLVRTVLVRKGYEVIEARNGEEAIALLEEEAPCVMILDLMMPKVNGFEVLDHLRERRPEFLKCVIVLTAVVDTVLTKLDKSEVFAALRKPFDVQELLQQVETCAREAQSPQTMG